MLDIQHIIDDFVKAAATCQSGQMRADWICHLLDSLATATEGGPEHTACLRAVRKHIEARLDEEHLVIIRSPPGSLAPPSRAQDGPGATPAGIRPPWFDDGE